MSGDDALSKERANRIADAVESIDESVSVLQNRQHLSRSEYKSDENRTVRRATEREFETVVEASLDITKVILKYETGQLPSRRKAMIRELGNQGVILPGVTEKMLTAVAFRDVLAHTYGSIVNDDKVYDALQDSLGKYIEFAEAIDSYLDAR